MCAHAHVNRFLFSTISKNCYITYNIILYKLFSASELGIKEFVPAYLDPNLQSKDLLTGVSFASGGSGYDPQTPKLVVL